MKTNLTLALVTALFLSPALMAKPAAEEKAHEHAHADIAGPNEGKILTEVEPHAELFVTKERKLQITFLDEHGKAVAPAEQTIAVICGERSNPTRLTLAKKGDSLLSDKPLPDGKNIPTVLQIKVKPDAKMVMIRLNLDLSTCSECKHHEYACTCDHHHE